MLLDRDSSEELHPTLHDAVCRFVDDLRFHETSLEIRKRTQSKLRPILRDFALAWDAFPIPLRFFTDEAALDFCREQLGYGNFDIADYRRTFRRGGKPGREGLADLTPEKPAIVSRWACPVVALDPDAAKDHGFDPKEAAELLEAVTKRAVSVSKG